MKALILPVVITYIIFSVNNLSMANNPHLSYIDAYKDLAIEEMHRTGIPASIKLAQGLLESNAGRSELATKANNHFGIKCGSTWKGGQYYREDDDYVNGKLVKSCFRVFNNVEESYRAHSAFLIGPGKNGRYASLFDYGTDYRRWAQGLQQAGYATDPNYPMKLISLIERYDLHQYDLAKPITDQPIAATPPEVPPLPKPTPLPDAANPTPVAPAPTPLMTIQYLNDIKFTEAGFGESLELLSQRTGVSEKRLLKYNDHLSGKNQLLQGGTRVFLQPKRSSYRGKTLWHVVQEGENLYYISQLYGVKMKSLYKRNRIPEGEEPIEGSSIKLRGGLVKIPPTLRNEAIISPVGVDDAGFLDMEMEAGSAAPPNYQPDNSPGTVPDLTPVTPAPQTDREQAFYYEVKQGDTLWSISRRYNLSLDELKRMNNLVSDQISIGMQLRIR